MQSRLQSNSHNLVMDPRQSKPQDKTGLQSHDQINQKEKSLRFYLPGVQIVAKTYDAQQWF